MAETRIRELIDELIVRLEIIELDDETDEKLENLYRILVEAGYGADKALGCD